MSRYAQRPSAQMQQARGQQRPPQQYYYEDAPGPRQGFSGGYPDDRDDDDEDTMVQTDISQLPPQHPHAHAQFNANPVAGMQRFDKSLPPDSVPRYAGDHRPMTNGGMLAPPAQQGRARSSSLDGRGRQEMSYPQPTNYGRPAPPQQPQRRMSRFNGVEDFGGPAVGYSQAGPPPPQQQSLRGRLPQNDDLDSDDDDDNFTAVSSGVQPDEYEDGDDDDATEMDYRQQQSGMMRVQAATYGRDPRDGHMHQRSLSTMGGFDNRSQAHYGQQGGQGSMQARRTSANFAGGSYSDRDMDYGNARQGTMLAPPQQIARPNSAGGMRSPSPRPGAVQGYTNAPPVQQAKPTPMGSVPDDTPEEKNLIRLLKDMNFSAALRDFHNRLNVGVQKTLVCADGFGHAYTKIHCKKLPKPEDLKKEPHLAKYWVPLAGSRWYFRTESHNVEIVFKTAALAAYEQQVRYGNARR